MDQQEDVASAEEERAVGQQLVMQQIAPPEPGTNGSKKPAAKKSP
jgi:hypothetical protein